MVAENCADFFSGGGGGEQQEKKRKSEGLVGTTRSSRKSALQYLRRLAKHSSTHWLRTILTVPRHSGLVAASYLAPVAAFEEKTETAVNEESGRGVAAEAFMKRQASTTQSMVASQDPRPMTRWDTWFRDDKTGALFYCRTHSTYSLRRRQNVPRRPDEWWRSFPSPPCSRRLRSRSSLAGAPFGLSRYHAAGAARGARGNGMETSAQIVLEKTSRACDAVTCRCCAFTNVEHRSGKIFALGKK